ncbi:hypothetical protein PsYK624_091980 [Phanerochaete sordida]|uniref:Uncharacterized protein n=1 Tax=Phanerochaete sordida TaxID=48140 RepID=A0A9P3LFW1_9APHY|nr:hypothetical protein PsYK624_091980 [Phanerochaete sordida]
MNPALILVALAAAAHAVPSPAADTVCCLTCSVKARAPSSDTFPPPPFCCCTAATEADCASKCTGVP